MTNRLIQRTKKMSENIENELVELLDKPFELFEKLQKIHRGNKRSRALGGDKEAKDITNQFIIKLNKNYGADICYLAVEAINAGFSKDFIPYIVDDAIPFLTLNLNSIISYFQTANMYSFQIVSLLTTEQPDFTNNLLTELIALGEEFTTDLICEIIHEQQNRNIADKHQQLLSLSNDSKLPVVRAAILGLGNLEYKFETDELLLQQTVERLEKYIAPVKQNIDEIRQAAVWALCKLLYVGDEIKNKVLILAKQQDPIACSRIIRFIFNQRKYIDNSEWFNELLMSFAMAPCENHEIVNDVDLILSILFEKEETQKLAEEFWIKWLILNSKQIYNNQLKNLFSSTFAKLIDKTNIYTPLVTKYINHDNATVVHSAFEVIDYIQSYRKTKIVLDQSTLQSFTQEELLYVCRKILGYVYLADVLQNLFYSILTTIIENNDAVRLIGSIFVTYIAKEYPTSTLAFLQDKQTNDERNRKSSEIISELIRDIELNIASRKELPKLNEITVSNKVKYQITLAKYNCDNQAMEEAQKGSFLDCVTKINLKYGKGSFNRFGGQYSQPSKLSSISHSMDIPTSESYQPVHAALHRINFRQAKKGQR